MSDRDFNPFDWYKNFFGRHTNKNRGRFFDDYFAGFEEMQEEMERIFKQFSNIQSNAPKELVREYQMPDGTKVREVGPIVYGYSMTIGPDGKPHISQFGNVKNLAGGSNKHELNLTGTGSGPAITAEREPLADVNTTEKEIKVIVEMPGIKKEDIKINATEGMVEITTTGSQRKYNKTIEIPPEADIDSARSNYTNGILEVVFNKKENVKPKGKEVKID
ncbi:MAG TPA: archaeal heat shock protein Hsp20 [Candidatus Nitrosocosmicus sp.]|jgi:HSP20 family protein|nr:archaeal heat shock protein Hsp20 [Candidatus Nitrosocosmicus sp.]